MRINEKIETTIIDALRACYSASPLLLEELRAHKLTEFIEIGEVVLRRIKGAFFGSIFQISTKNTTGIPIDLGTLKFDRTTSDDPNYQKNNMVWLWFSNQTLYKPELFTLLLTATNNLHLQFSHITAIDLALDTNKSIVNIITKCYKDKQLTTIINGKEIKDRKQVISGFYSTYSISLDRKLNPTLHLKQAKAKGKKSDGLSLCAYNKLAEIEDSNKNYILDFYGRPKRLHRLEVRINAVDLNKFFAIKKIPLSFTTLYDQGILDDLFYTHLARILRFRKGRTVLDWRNLLH